jgi:hypothetical protein
LQRSVSICVLPLLALLCVSSLSAQDNYEIQVYGSDLVSPHATMLELHSNFTFQGSKEIVNGVLPTNHALHETVEITHGFSDWFETGFYVFTSAKNGYGLDWVGDHIRPRVAIPEKWKWPVGLSLSAEVGYQRPTYSEDKWTVELRPIIDKKTGRWYWAFNPTFDKSLQGLNAGKGWDFSPNVKIAYDFTPKVTGGLEYYGSLGPVTNIDPISDQQQQILPAIDLNLSPKWEINFGVGVGVTRGTDHLLVKSIIGYRFDRIPWQRGKNTAGSRKTGPSKTD